MDETESSLTKYLRRMENPYAKLSILIDDQVELACPPDPVSEKPANPERKEINERTTLDYRDPDSRD